MFLAGARVKRAFGTVLLVRLGSSSMVGGCIEEPILECSEIRNLDGIFQNHYIMI